MIEEFIWAQKYRPKTINDTILPDRIKESLNGFIEKDNIPNLIFSGSSGIGKTTSAFALCEQLGMDTYLVNASKDGGIDTLRNQIQNFASSVSFSGKRKCVILDEAEQLSPQTMLALRGMMEEFSKNCVYILTCNNKNRIIDAIHSRCTVIDFSLNRKDIEKLAPLFMKRLIYILDNEKIEYDKPVLVELIKKYFPDWRRTINELQRYSVSGKIDTGILSNINDVSIKEVIGYLKNKEFTKMRKWVSDNNDIDVPSILEKLYNQCYQYISKETIPAFILLINKCQVQHTTVANPEINLCAFFVEVMVEVKWLNN